MTNKKDKFDVHLDGNHAVPPLNEALDEYLQPGIHEALAEFTSQAQIYFPQILEDERDQTAAKIHLENLQEQINRSNKDSNEVATALKALSKIGDKKQDDMMACALLDYIDEILEMIDSESKNS